jgi:hypothetical protein
MPGQKSIRTVKIYAGGQSQLLDDLTGSSLENVIAQLVSIGAVPEGDIRAIVLPKQLIYRVAPTPIKVDVIAEGLSLEEDARQEVAGQKLEEAGLGAFKIAADASKKERLHPVETSIEIVETDANGRVEGGVNTEFVVSTKRERVTKKRTEKKT